jgi:hypothetical protein
MLRGAGGKYVSSEKIAGGADGVDAHSQESSQSPPLKTTRNPNISVDLDQLCSTDTNAGENIFVTRAQSHITGSEIERAENRLSRRKSKASFIGESWYASYLLSHTSSEHANLHQPMLGYQTRNTRGRSRDAIRVNNPESNSTNDELPSDLPAPALLDKLIDAYFTRFHVFCPILDKELFLSSLRNKSISHTLLRSVIFVASIHCDPEVFHLMGYSTRLDAGDGLFSKARTAFDTDEDSDRITMLLSSFFLHYWFGQPTTFRDFLWWLATAIRSAQCMGMHRTTINSKLPSADRRMWRRIWWCLYV